MIKSEIWHPTFENYPSESKDDYTPFILAPTIKNAEIIQKPFSLILLSHGTGGNRIALA